MTAGGPHPKRHTHGNYMETNRNLHNPHDHVITYIRYTCELWDPNKEEKAMINRILDNGGGGVERGIPRYMIFYFVGGVISDI